MLEQNKHNFGICIEFCTKGDFLVITAEFILLHVKGQNSHDGDFLWKAEFTYKHKNQSSNE